MNFPLLTSELENEFNLRISKVRLAMQNAHIDALLIGSTVNIFYLTGGVYRGYVYIPVDRDPLILAIPPAEIEHSQAVSIRKPEQIPDVLESRGYARPRNIGLEYDDMYYSDVKRLENVFSGIEVKNGSKAMREARLTKTAYEQQKMREDGVKQCSVYSRIARCYSEEMSDIEFQIEIERVLRKEGCLGYLRAAGPRMELNMGSVLAGPNADEPSPYDFSMGGAGADPSLPAGASGQIMKPGMTVMVDMNGGFNGYQTDMTRCWSIGEPTAEMVRAHECSRRILRDLEGFGRPGAEIGEMYRRALRTAHSEGLGDYFMGHRHKVAFIGHGVGIELNEAPVLMDRNKGLLEENMTIAIEPKFVLPGIGAVGVENTYIVGAEGLINITPLHEELEGLR